MKALAISIVALVLMAVTGGAASAHLDNLGAPDPYWQTGNASAASGDVASGSASATPGAARFLQGFVYVSGGTALLLLLSLLRMLFGSKQRSWD